jgi:exosortase
VEDKIAIRPVRAVGDYLRSLGTPRLILLALVLLVLGWSFRPNAGRMVNQWWWNQQYSHGYLVPFFSLALLWLRRNQLATVATWKPSNWGLAIIAASVLVRLTGTYLYLEWIEDFSFLICLAGFTVLLGGWPALRWAGPSVGFLFFMLPLPYRVDTAMAFELRTAATEASAYALQTFGFAALAHGTNIHLNDHQLQVAPACSGMGMLLVFFALSTAIALVIDRVWWEKVVILLLALPNAILANVARIVVTAMLFQLSDEGRAQAFFHDWAGLLVMMPTALLLLWLELTILKKLFLEVETSHRPSFEFARATTVRARARHV